MRRRDLRSAARQPTTQPPGSVWWLGVNVASARMPRTACVNRCPPNWLAVTSYRSSVRLPQEFWGGRLTNGGDLPRKMWIPQAHHWEIGVEAKF